MHIKKSTLYAIRAGSVRYICCILLHNDICISIVETCMLATTLEGPPPSPRTETPRSQRYSKRVSNQTKRNHNSISTSPIPLPQATAITCLSEPAPTNQLATLSQDQQAKRTRQTKDALPGTRKRTRSQIESQQHTPLTQILDTVALNSAKQTHHTLTNH
jgi:hypothetical protein